jgi:hypothetical protein
MLVDLINLQSDLRGFSNYTKLTTAIHQSHDYFKSKLEYTLQNFASNTELHYYLLGTIDFGEAEGRHYRLVDRVGESHLENLQVSSSLDSLQ